MSRILLLGGIFVLTLAGQMAIATTPSPAGAGTACPNGLPGPNYRCFNLSLPLDHGVTTAQTMLINTLVGYDNTQPGTNGEQVTVVLSEGCQFQNAEWMKQWTAYTQAGKSNTYNNAVVFAQPRGSGFSYGDLQMCPDDMTGQNMVPSTTCATGFVKSNDINKYYNLWQMANDLQKNILPGVSGLYGTSPTIRIVGGDLFGNAWIQKWQQLFPTPTVNGGTPVQYIVFTSPPALERYDFMEALVQNPETNVRTVLSQCGMNPQCSKYFGGSDVNQVLTAVMKSARQKQLPCNDAISNAWTTDMGEKPDPIWTFYSDLFGMLIRNPQDAFGDWDDKLPALIPGVLYRIQRCNGGDVTALTKLYTSLRSKGTSLKTANTGGNAQDPTKCYISPVVRWAVVFSNLLQAPRGDGEALLTPENDNDIVPMQSYVKSLADLYSSWPATSSAGNSKTNYAQGDTAFQIIVGAVNPLVKPQQTIFAVGEHYDFPRIAPSNPSMTSFGSGPFFDAVILPTGNQRTLYASAEYNDGQGFSCAIGALLNIDLTIGASTGVALPKCITNTSQLTQFDFSAADSITQSTFNTYMGTSSAFNRGTDGPLAPAKTNPPAPLIPTPEPPPPTPLPPGETYAPPTPLPPGETYAPPTPEPPVPSGSSYHYQESITITGNDKDDIHVHISVGGLVAAILGGVVLLVLVAVCVGKCVQRRMNDPGRRDFYREVYGNQGNATSLNAGGQENIYRNV